MAGKYRLVAVLTGLALAAGTLAGTAGSTSSLASQARWVARHGGVTGTCAGCATRRMRALSYALVAERFRPLGSRVVQHALCIVRHESGGNPGAVNGSSYAAGLSQVEPFWHRVLPRLNFLDPVDGVAAFWYLTSHGRDFYSNYDRWARYRC